MTNRKAETLSFRIAGDKEGQILEINLAPQKHIWADASFLLYTDEEIEIETITNLDLQQQNQEEDTNDPSEYEDDDEDTEPDEPQDQTLLNKIVKVVGVIFSGKKEDPEKDAIEWEMPPEMPEEEEEPNIFYTQFSNQSDYIRSLAFAPPRGAQIVEIYIDQSILFQQKLFLCAYPQIKITDYADLTNNIEEEFFFSLEKAEGNAALFLFAEGHLTERNLTEGDSIRVNLLAIVALEDSIIIDKNSLQKIPSLYGSRNTWLITLRGEGRVWLQTSYRQYNAIDYHNLTPNTQGINNQEESPELFYEEENLPANEEEDNHFDPQDENEDFNFEDDEEDDYSR
ncbi:MAG: AIM24 family protein [Cytophagales bacterium]|nr:MAG: AIM24 family protein [Cytophagales bacterium]